MEGNLAPLIKNVENEYGIRQGKVAEMIGISKQTFSTWVNQPKKAMVDPKKLYLLILMLMGTEAEPLERLVQMHSDWQLVSGKPISESIGWMSAYIEAHCEEINVAVIDMITRMKDCACIAKGKIRDKFGT